MTEGSRLFRNPCLDTSKNAWVRMLKIDAQYGFTPASHADMEIFQKPQESDKIREILMVCECLPSRPISADGSSRFGDGESPIFKPDQ